MSKARRHPLRLPVGVHDLLPDSAEAIAAQRARLTEVLECWGFRPVVTPAVEYAAVLEQALKPEGHAELFLMVEPGTGEVVALRPDITPQIARLCATRLQGLQVPLRLRYDGRVVRRMPGSAGEGVLELFQLGTELIGEAGPGADAEIVALAGALLEASRVPRFSIDLGLLDFTAAVLEAAAFDADAIEDVTALLARKELSALQTRLRATQLDAATRALVGALPELYGGREIIAEARKLLAARPVPAASAALDRLEAVLAELDASGFSAALTVDMGEVRGLDYYTGMTLRGYVEGAGDALLSGGRYDRLISAYGRSVPAVGFACDLRGLSDLAEDLATPREQGVLALVDTPLTSEAAARIADLRAGGERTVVLRDATDAERYRQEQRLATILDLRREEGNEP